MNAILARTGIERVRHYRALGRYAVVLIDGRLGQGRCVRDAYRAAHQPGAENMRNVA